MFWGVESNMSSAIVLKSLRDKWCVPVDKKPKPPTEDDPGAEERFERGVRNALSMPPKPHKDEPPKRPKRPA